MNTIEHVLDLKLKLPEIADAFRLSETVVTGLFTSGASAHAFYEAILAKRLKMSAAESDSDSYSLVSKSNEGVTYGVRCMHQHGVSFARYSNIGASRKFSEQDFIDRTQSLTGYYVIDTENFPIVPVYFISSALVAMMYEDQLINRAAYLSRGNFFKLVKYFDEQTLAA